MSFNQPPPGGRRNSDDGPDWGNMFGKVVLGGLALGAGALAVAKILEGSSDKEGRDDVEHAKYASGQSPSSTRSTDSIIIGIDASPTTGGGILVIPQIRTVYYYIADLTNRFTFGIEPDKFEMVNAFVSLEVFADHIVPYYIGTGVKVMTDNNFSSETSYTHTRNSGYKVLQNRVTERLKGYPFYGEWKQVSRDESQIKIADKLSRQNLTAANEKMLAEYPGYSQKELDAYPAVYKVYQAVQKIARDYPELNAILKQQFITNYRELH